MECFPLAASKCTLLCWLFRFAYSENPGEEWESFLANPGSGVILRSRPADSAGGRDSAVHADVLRNCRAGAGRLPSLVSFIIGKW